MSKKDFSKERRNKNERQEAEAGPDMSNVVTVPEKPKPIKSLAGLAGYKFEGFDTPSPDSGPPENSDPEPEGLREISIEELAEEMAALAAEDHKDDEPDKDPAREMTEMEKALSPIEKARQAAAELLVDVDREVQEHREQKSTASEILEQVKMLQAKEREVREIPATLAKVRDAIKELLKVNPEVQRLLDAEEAVRTAEAARVARASRQEQISALYADLPNDTEAAPNQDGTPRKLNSPTAAIAATQKVGDSAILVVRIPMGTIVPTERGGREKLSVDSNVQLKITVDKVEGIGKDRRIFRQAHVTKWVGPLHFHAQKAWREGESGTFNLIPPFFTLKDEAKRGDDPFNALKEAIFVVHNREYIARMQMERLDAAKAGAELTATQLLLERAVGSASVESDWVVKTQDGQSEYSRHLEVVLRRDEEDGPIHLVAWGPPPRSRFSPHLNMFQPRRDGNVLLNVEAKVEEDDGGRPKTYVRFSPRDESMTRGNDEGAKRAKAALRDLNMTTRQALINEHAAGIRVAAPEPEGVADEAPPTETEHRCYYRKDDSCRCGATKPSDS